MTDIVKIYGTENIRDYLGQNPTKVEVFPVKVQGLLVDHEGIGYFFDKETTIESVALSNNSLKEMPLPTTEKFEGAILRTNRGDFFMDKNGLSALRRISGTTGQNSNIILGFNTMESLDSITITILSEDETTACFCGKRYSVPTLEEIFTSLLSQTAVDEVCEARISKYQAVFLAPHNHAEFMALGSGYDVSPKLAIKSNWASGEGTKSYLEWDFANGGTLISGIKVCKDTLGKELYKQDYQSFIKKMNASKKVRLSRVDFFASFQRPVLSKTFSDKLSDILDGRERTKWDYISKCLDNENFLTLGISEEVKFRYLQQLSAII